MSDTLSKDEVDALLQGMQDGDVAVEGDAAPRGAVRPYDLFAEDRLTGRRFPALDLVHERFLRRLRVTLASLAGVTPTLSLGAVDTVRFSTFRNRLPAGACLQLFGMAPLRGQGLFAVSAPLAFALIDRVFGGPGKLPATLEGREYSTLELQTLQRVSTRVLADLGDSWTPVHPVDCKFARVEQNAAHLALTAPSDPVVAVEIACDLGEGPSPIVIALPYSMLEPLRDRLGASQAAPVSGSDREWVARMGVAVRQADVTVSAELGSHEISARELLRLKAGDVLALGARDDDPVTLRVENVRVMTGLAGVSRGQNAVRVLGVARGE